jgi:hypothetical protein
LQRYQADCRNLSRWTFATVPSCLATGRVLSGQRANQLRRRGLSIGCQERPERLPCRGSWLPRRMATSPNQMLCMLCAASPTRSVGSDSRPDCVCLPRRAASESDARTERGPSTNRARVAQWVEHMTSEWPDVCPMRHEGSRHAKRAGSDALCERGLACPSGFSRMRRLIMRLRADPFAGHTISRSRYSDDPRGKFEGIRVILGFRPASQANHQLTSPTRPASF